MKTLQIIKQDSCQTITLIQDEESKVKYIQKELKFYDKALYQKLQNLKNPHIPKIYVIQENNHVLTLIEEYIEGDTLKDKCFPKKEVQQIMHQLCTCLKAIHNLDPPIIHRDIKPENIIYHNHKVTLLDFNIARFQDKAKTNDTQILGTVGYAAPEQFGFVQSSPQTDIYALGKLMNYISNGSIKNLDGICLEYKAIISKACQLDFKNRYHSVQEMDLALQGKRFIIPGINNERKVSILISWFGILIDLYVLKNMDPSTSTFCHYNLELVASFLFLYFPLFLYYNKLTFSKLSKKISWPLLYTLLLLILTVLDFVLFTLIDEII